MSPQARKKSAIGKRNRKRAAANKAKTPSIKEPKSNSKYDPKYCEQIIRARGKEGLSEMGFAGSIGVCKNTITEWGKMYPEFQRARELAQAAAREFYDRLGIAGMTGRIKNFNVTAWIWVGKNCFGMSDKIQQHNSYGPLRVEWDNPDGSTGGLSVSPHQFFPNAPKDVS